MKVLVTGAGGMLAHSLIPVLKERGWSVQAYPKSALDVTELNAVRRTVSRTKPTWIVNLAAYTRVDDAERDSDEAFRVNAFGARNLAMAARSTRAKLLHVSTDYVFSGAGPEPIREYDDTAPISAYGHSKLAGERAVRDLLPEHLIVRTAWLYGPGGKNFVDAIIQRIVAGSKPKVVNDQRGAPTYARDLSEALANLIHLRALGTYHVTNTGQCSWFEFAHAIRERYFQQFKTAYLQHATQVEIDAITSETLGRPARRPAFSVLDTSAYRHLTKHVLRDWRAGLDAYLTAHAEQIVRGQQ